MPKIQIELSEKESQFVEIYKAKNKLDNKADAVAKIIADYMRQME